MRVRILIALLLVIAGAAAASAQSTAFTYQGKLSDGANPASGTYDMQFKLFDTATVGTGVQQGPTITNSSVSATAGIFTVQLDFGAGAFSGPPRFLEIGVRSAGSPDPYTLLSPRQPVTSTPYAVRSLNALVADTLSSACVGCVTSTQVGSVAGSAVTGQIPVASVPPGSGNYVQNTTSQQAASNFNISGDGTAGGTLTGNIVRTTTQFNIGVNHALSLGSAAGVFAGRLAGASNTTGSGNSFFGDSAGRFNSTSSNNSFFGRDAGTLNTASDNSFFGAFAGDSNTTGTRNSFFGRTAGDANQTGADNSFFGYNAGKLNTDSLNSFFGSNSGAANTTGCCNSFFGNKAGAANTNANYNSFFGVNAGGANTTGFTNAFFGAEAGFSNTTASDNSFFGAGAGHENTIGTQNSFFGRSAGLSNVSGNDNAFFGYHAGSNNIFSFNSFFGSGAGDSNTTGCCNSFFGYHAGQANQTGANNSFFGLNAGSSTTADDNSFFGTGAGGVNTTGQLNSFFGGFVGTNNTTGFNNAFFGYGAANANTTGDHNTAIGALANFGANNLTFATAIGAGSVASLSNSIYLGRANGTDAVRIPGSVVIDGTLVVGSLGSAGSTSICLNASDRISPCSSSLRYKTSVQSFTGGLDIVRRLRPITFNWKEGGMTDVGFAAEEVDKIEPLLTTRDDKGEIEGVKYGQLTTVLVNAVKEQQLTIERQQQQINKQGRQLEVLKKLVCVSNPQAEVCK